MKLPVCVWVLSVCACEHVIQFLFAAPICTCNHRAGGGLCQATVSSSTSKQMEEVSFYVWQKEFRSSTGGVAPWSS
jgi:hypothetical protein